MKLIFCLSVLIACSMNVYCWTAIEQTDNSTDHPGYCFSKDSKVGAMEKDEVRQLMDECAEVSCSEGGFVTFNRCGYVIAEPPCVVVQGNFSYPYPRCCDATMC